MMNEAREAVVTPIIITDRAPELGERVRVAHFDDGRPRVCTVAGVRIIDREVWVLPDHPAHGLWVPMLPQPLLGVDALDHSLLLGDQESGWTIVMNTEGVKRRFKARTC